MNQISRCRPMLGTYVEIELEDASCSLDLVELSNRAFRVIERIEARMSFHRADSELSRLNREAQHGPVALSADMWAVIRTGLELSSRSKGAFDMTVAPHLIKRGLLPNPESADACLKANWKDLLLRMDGTLEFYRPLCLDLGGIAKGYAVDKAVEEVKACTSYCINAGGDLRMWPWHGRHVAIRGPQSNDNTIEVRMQGPALATSSGLPGSNTAILCPQTKTWIRGDQSVSVFASSCMQADALTKAVSVMRDCDELLREYNSIGFRTGPAGGVPGAS